MSLIDSSAPSTAAPNIPNGKAAAVAPKLSDSNHVELENIPTNERPVNPDEDIMQLARMGDIPAIESLYDSGKFDASYCDAEGITPLHWAAINNQYAMCQFLIKAGADVNKKGGESVATPAMWAAQRCHYYTVHLLLEHGADPLVTDVQGYNILHLATFEGNIFLLVLLLHQSIPVDVPDSHGHTCLMWAAYKGYPACVDLFLRWGADVHATDETGFTALHWALVKGSQGCIQKLVEYGADRFAETTTGKTPAITADEMKTSRMWHRALKECGYDENALPITISFPMSSWLLKDKRSFMKKFFFFWPFLILWAMLMVSSHMVVFAGIPIALLIGYGLQWVAQQVMEYAPSDMRHFHKTPWLAGIFAATLFWVGLNWLTKILPRTFSASPFTNIAFGTMYSLCGYFYFCTMVYEPGFVPKLGGLTQQKTVIDELLSIWKFDEQNFCVPCMVRMPLRSKHCKRCNRCVAKHDHHCPWVYNCIGVNNHRHFFLYLITLEIGISLLVRLTISYYEIIADGASSECNLLGPGFCKIVNADSYTLVVAFWATLQLTWVTMLLFVQLVQISRAVTTWENMKGANHGHGHGSKASEAITSALTAGTTSLAGAQLGHTGLGPDPALPPTHAPRHHHKAGCFAQWKKILGVDTFVETAMHGYEGNRNRRRAARNPFSRGTCSNCKDFWCDPAPVFGKRENGAAVLGGEVINYTMMYEAPSRQSSRGGYQSVGTDDSV
ncbi:palmitoyltransferase-4 [Coleophoma cylindrospora]|uniref:Palmitoyltransferase n=1 Tax=Coleophoma cylindrospora TaxID=1849047 RepID=A0A3D8QCQ9_9HELO|nr:palmitoyltransferase-4 [Coleophoma cylindrospora]